MKFKNYKKLILPVAIVILLVFIPIQSYAAVTGYNFIYNVQNAGFSDTTAIRAGNNCYVVVKSQPIGNYYTIVKNQSPSNNNYYIIEKNQNRVTSNFYIVSRNDYLKPQPAPQPEPQPVPRPEPRPQPTPQPVPQPQPTPQPVPQPQPTPQPVPQPRPEPNPKPVPDTGNASNGRNSLTSEEIQMVDYVNKARQEAGLKSLQIDSDLAYIARLKSQDMYDNNYFSHDSPTYGSPFDMMTKFGIKYNGAAENIAKNSSVAAAQNAFMRSQGHKDNILNPIYTHIGVGIYKGYYTQMFIRK